MHRSSLCSLNYQKKKKKKSYKKKKTTIKRKKKHVSGYLFIFNFRSLYILGEKQKRLVSDLANNNRRILTCKCNLRPSCFSQEHLTLIMGVSITITTQNHIFCRVLCISWVGNLLRPDKNEAEEETQRYVKGVIKPHSLL